MLSAEGDRMEWRSTRRDPTPADAVRLIALLGLPSNPSPVVSVGDAEILHAFLAEGRRSPPVDPAQRAALADLYRYLGSREWVPPHLSREYAIRARALHPLPGEETEGAPGAISPASVPESGSMEPPTEEPIPGPAPEPVPEPEPPLPLPEPVPEPVPEPEPEPEPEERAPAPVPPAASSPPAEPGEVMKTVTAELAGMKEELRGEIAKERERVDAWIRDQTGAVESKERALLEREQSLEVKAKAVEEEKRSVTERLQALEKDERRLGVLKALGEVPGMTEGVAKVLAAAFPDLDALRSADAKALEQCQGVSAGLAKAIRLELVPGEVEGEARAIDLREEAQAFLEEGDYRAALQCYDRLLAEHPEEKVFWFDKAELHVLLDEPDDALQCYTRVLDLDRRDRQAWFERANLLFGMGRLADAVDALREALRIEPRKSGDVVLKADQLRRDGQANEAAILYQAVLDVDAENRRAILGLGDTFLSLGDIDAAEGLFGRALGKGGKDPEILFMKGELLRRKGRWGAAIQFYNRALALQWDLADAWLAKGEVLLAHERPQEALESFEKVLSFRPDQEAARAGKRDAEAMLRQPPPPARAAEAIPSGPEESPAEPEREGEAPEEPTFAEELRRAGGESQGPPTGTGIPADFKAFVENVESEREDTAVLLQLAELALDGGDPDMALLRFDEAVAQDPKSAKAWTGKGTALQQLDRYAEALAAYDRALELNPGDEIAQRWRETCVRHMRRGGKA